MQGIHHVTAIAGKPQRNLDFYTRTLGLRFVKKTVNFDDPGTYHFYFGDETGSPGTILTFFPWEHAAPGRAGVGLAQTTAFRVPAALDRLLGAPLRREGRGVRGGDGALRRDGAAPSPIPTAWVWPWWASPGPRRSRPGATARSRPSMPCAASTASP